MSRLFEYRVPDTYYEQKLNKLLCNGGAVTPRYQNLFRSVSDEFWLWLHTEGVRVNPRLRELLPGMPDESTQLQANGLSGDRAMHDGLLVYRLFKTIFGAVAGDLGSCQAILDFGCGWGRVTRFFLRDIEPDKAITCTCLISSTIAPSVLRTSSWRPNAQVRRHIEQLAASARGTSFMGVDGGLLTYVSSS